MAKSIAIPKGRPDHPVLDYEVLRAEGILHLENLATELWTDFNTHDPGITMLELLCYAITDLGYRTRKLPIGDLLAGGGDGAFFGPTEVLPCAPVTALDYRKLLIDVTGIKNAWVRKQLDPTLFKEKSSSGETSKVLQLQKINSRPFLKFKEIVKDGKADKGKIKDFLKGILNAALLIDNLVDIIANKVEMNPPSDLWGIKDELDKLVDANGNKRFDVEAVAAAVAATDALCCRYGYYPLITTPKSDSPNDLLLDGLVQIILDIDDTLDPENKGDYEPVVQRVMRRLQANRSLGQDYVAPPLIVGKVPVAICLHLEVESGLNDMEVAAEAVWRIQQHLAPLLRFHTFKEMLQRHGTEDIYDGPLLNKGFLDDEAVESAQLLKTFFHSDLTHAATIPGQTNVRELKVKIPKKGKMLGEATFTEQTQYDIPYEDLPGTPIQEDGRPMKAILDLCNSCIFVTQNGTRREIPHHVLEEPLRLKKLLAQCYDERGDWPAPVGVLRSDLADYRSLQFDLPAVYGVGDNGAAGNIPTQRKGYRKQLQAYLAFFDQLLKAYLLQLKEVRQLLSVQQDINAPTYLTADLMDIPGLADIIDPAIPFSAESPAVRQERRNRAMDHLLARFGERFSDYVLNILRPDSGADDAPLQEHFTAYLEEKSEFLREVATLAEARSRGHNYRAAVWGTANVAGIKKSVHLRLGLEGTWHEDHLVPKPTTYEVEVVPLNSGAYYQIQFKIIKSGLPPGTSIPSNGILLKSKRYTTIGPAKANLQPIKAEVWRKEHYSVGPHPKESDRWAVLFTLGGKTELFSDPWSQEEAEKLLDFVKWVLELKASGELEGFHLIEHILLRPNDPADELLALSMGCDPSTSPKDPYSNWLTVVAPNWPKRFKTPEGRMEFEQAFRLEMPAGLALRLCWVDQQQMRVFEDRYKAWLDAKAKCTPEECHVTKAANLLIQWLNETPCSCGCTDDCTADTACKDCKSEERPAEEQIDSTTHSKGSKRQAL